MSNLLQSFQSFFCDLGVAFKAMGSPSLHRDLLVRELWRGFRKSDDEDSGGSGFPSSGRIILLAMAGVGLAIFFPQAIQAHRTGSTVATWLWGVPAALCGALFVLFIIAAIVGTIVDLIGENCGKPVTVTSFHHGSFWFMIYFWASVTWISSVFFWPGSGWLLLGRALGIGTLLGYPIGTFLGLYLGRMDIGMKRWLSNLQWYVALPILIFDLVACLPLLKV
jgi:hypothetical protein